MKNIRQMAAEHAKALADGLGGGDYLNPQEDERALAVVESQIYAALVELVYAIGKAVHREAADSTQTGARRIEQMLFDQLAPGTLYGKVG